MLDFLFSPNNVYILLAMFILIALALKQVISVVKNVFYITAVAVIAPIALNKLLSVPISIDTNSLLFFIGIGLTIYLIFLISKSIYNVLGSAEKSVKNRKAKAEKAIKKVDESK